MNILVTAATRGEIVPIQQFLAANWDQYGDNSYSRHDSTLQLSVSGVGMMASTFSLSNTLNSNKFDLAIQLGIGGSYDKDIVLGEVVFVTSEQLGDMGAEDKYNFLDIFDLSLTSADEYPFTNGKLINPVSEHTKGIQLKTVSGLTINTVAGSSFTATARFEKYGCQLESMEGAAFHYVSLQKNIPFIQVRSVSNYVETRDRSSWKIPEALENLNAWFKTYLEELIGY